MKTEAQETTQLNNIDDNTLVSDLIGTDVPEEVEEVKEEIDVESDELKKAREEVERLEQRKTSLDEEATRLEENGETLGEEIERLEKEKQEFEALEKIRERKIELEQEIVELNKRSMINELLRKRKITKDLKGWAESLTYEQLEYYDTFVQGKKTILDEKNETNMTDDDMEEWRRKQMHSRIIS